MFVLILGFILSSFPFSCSSSQNHFDFEHDSSANDYNPFRGFCTSYSWGISTDFPLSMEFSYISLRSTMTNFTTFNWTTLESILSSAASRNRHAIVRFYIDYPNTPTGIPEFLFDLGLQYHNYSDYGGGISPFYNDSNLQLALLNFISYFGAEYNGDDRLAVVQTGLLGYWGEWHVYPNTQWMWSSTFEEEVLDAFKDAFPDTQLNTREPDSVIVSKDVFGYHDDSFTYSTIGDPTWYFYNKLVIYNDTNRYKKTIMGGELRPENQDIIFTNSYEIGGDYTQNWTQCVRQTGVSYMLFAYAFNSGWDNDTYYNRALNGMREMGYDIWMQSCDITVYNTTITIEATMMNSGVAPFYYDLSVMFEFGVMNVEWDINFSIMNGSLQKNWLLGGESAVIKIVVSGQDIWDSIDNAGGSGMNNVDMVLNVSLYSSMMMDGNPIRLANEEIDWNSATVMIENAFELTRNENDTYAATEYETSDEGDSESSGAICTVVNKNLIEIVVTVILMFVLALTVL